jgi:hypothetical protein
MCNPTVQDLDSHTFFFFFFSSATVNPRRVPLAAP